MSPSNPNPPASDAPEGTATVDLALADDLTGLHNRRYLRQLFETEWQTLIDREGRIGLLLLDLDLFKEVNDRYGHLAGDAVLRGVARRLRESFREGDRVVRYGGDEFVVVLPGAGDDEARRLAERSRSALAAERWIDPATGDPIEQPLTFSVGIASAPVDGPSGEEVLAAADRRLYEEKRARRAELEVASRPSRWRGALGLWPVALAAAVAAILLWSAGQRPAPPAPTAAESVERRLLADEELERREAEIRALREEVDRLHAAVAAASSAADRERFERRILELEAALERRARAAAAPEPASTPPQNATPPAALDPTIRATPPPVIATAAAPAPAHAAEPTATPARAPRIEPPQLLSHRPPVYPQLALARGLEAQVDFRIRVDAEGSVVMVEPLGAPAGFGFDAAARTAALSARYRPGRRDGLPVVMETTLRIEFRRGGER